MVWTEKCEDALMDIIAAVISGGLMLARFDLPFVIYSDFSCDGLGAVLV